MRVPPTRVAQAVASVYGVTTPRRMVAVRFIPCPACGGWRILTICPTCRGDRSVAVFG